MIEQPNNNDDNILLINQNKRDFNSEINTNRRIMNNIHEIK